MSARAVRIAVTAALIVRTQVIGQIIQVVAEDLRRFCRDCPRSLRSCLARRVVDRQMDPLRRGNCRRP